MKLLSKDKLFEKKKEDLVEATAIVVETTPLFAALESLNPINPMSYEMSLNSRFFAAGLVFVGFSKLYCGGRKRWKNKLGITQKTSEKIQFLSEAGYGVLFNACFSPPFYAASQFISGEDFDLNKIAVGTCIAMGVGLGNGWPVGYAIDMFKDLSGLESCERSSYPKFIKKQKSFVKKGIAAGLVGAMIGATSLIYSIAYDDKIQEQNPVAIEQSIDQSNNSLELLVK